MAEGIFTAAVHPVRTAQHVGAAWDRFIDLPGPAKTKAVCRFVAEAKTFGPLFKMAVRAVHPIPFSTYIDRTMNAWRNCRQLPEFHQEILKDWKTTIQFEKMLIRNTEIPSIVAKVFLILPRTSLKSSYCLKAFNKVLQYGDNRPFLIQRISSLKELQAAVQLSAPISTLWIQTHGSAKELSFGHMSRSSKPDQT